MTVLHKHTKESLAAEFDRQADVLLRKGYTELAGENERELRARLEPLRGQATALAGTAAADADLPFAIVAGRALATVGDVIERVEWKDKPLTTATHFEDMDSFVPIEGVSVPKASVYLAIGIDTGRATLNVTPDAALDAIRADGRSPLTLEEGLAVVTHHPEILKEKNCFSMLGSRCGDRRVPALWLSDGKPKLGWCWAGNPHTWLGSASCASRAG